ncbi:hypothetical protein DV738_g3708, partial [Chaetothyriales sp. CBS 135597]
MSNFFLPPDSPFAGTLVQQSTASPPSYRLHSITIQAVDFFPPTPATAPKPRIGFLKLQADIAKNDASRESLPGAVFMRGGSVAVLVILTPAPASEEPRIATGSLAFVELPAGMIDAEDGSFTGAAAREIREETGLEIRQDDDELLDLTNDEFIPILAVRKTLSRSEIERLRGKKTGLREEGEKITLKLVKLKDLWKVGARDAKTVAAWALWQGLKAEGKV